MKAHEQQASRIATEALEALALPSATPEERAALKESIAAEGVLVPVVVSAEPARPDVVADGLARVEICAELGINCPSERRGFASEADFQLYRLVISSTGS